MDYYETEKYVFVHGWLPENALTPEARHNASKEAWEKARWVRWNERYVGLSPLADKTLVCGHVPTWYANALDPSRNKNSYEIFYDNGIIAIDAGTADTKQVNVLILEDKGRMLCLARLSAILPAYNSFGNGSAMRVSPVAWVANSLEQAETLAKWSAEVTHNHPEGIKGTQAVAAAIYLARTGIHRRQWQAQ